MTGFLESNGLSVLRRALDSLSLRQQVIGNNLANMDTPGFKASEVVFEQALQRAIAGRPDNDARMRATHAQHLGGTEADVRPAVMTLNGAARADGNTVDVDREMARLAETQISYSVAAKLVNTKLALLRSIATKGRS